MLFSNWRKYYHELSVSKSVVEYYEPEVPLNVLLARVPKLQELPAAWRGEIKCGHDDICLSAVKALVCLYYLVYGRWLDAHRVSVGLAMLENKEKCICHHLHDTVSDVSDAELRRGGNGVIMDCLFKLAVAERNGSGRAMLKIDNFINPSEVKVGAQIKRRMLKRFLGWHTSLQELEERFSDSILWMVFGSFIWIGFAMLLIILHPIYSFKSIRRATDISTLLSILFMLFLLAACLTVQLTIENVWHRGRSSWANGTNPVIFSGQSHINCTLKHQWWEYDVVLVSTDKDLDSTLYEDEQILLRPGGPYSYCHDQSRMYFRNCDFPETIGDMKKSFYLQDWACAMVAGARNVRENQEWISWRADLLSISVFGVVFIFELGRILLLGRLKAGQGSLFSFSFIVRSSQAIAEAFAWNSSDGLDLPACTLCGKCDIIPWPRIEYADGASWHYFCKVGPVGIERIEPGRFAVDARPRIVFKKGLRYKEGRIGAVSHAWEDGLISELGARSCIYNRLVAQSNELGLDYLWIDGANLGPDGVVKRWRLTEMGLVYSAATAVIVVSKDVLHSGLEVLKQSTWNSRVWTAQEWLSASSLYCLGNSGILDASEILEDLMTSSGYQLGEDASCVKVLAKKEGYRRTEQGFILWALIGQKTNRRSLNFVLLLFSAFAYLAGLALISFALVRNEVPLMYATPIIVFGFLLNEEVRGRMYQPEKFSRLQLSDVLKRMNTVPAGVINAAGPRAETFGHCWVPTNTALQCIGVGQRIKVSDFGLVLNRWKIVGDCLIVAPDEFVAVISRGKLMDKFNESTLWLWWVGEFVIWLIGFLFLWPFSVLIQAPRNGHVIGRCRFNGSKDSYERINLYLG